VVNNTTKAPDIIRLWLFIKIIIIIKEKHTKEDGKEQTQQ